VDAQTRNGQRQAARANSRPRLGRPRLLIVGCGDIGLRIVARLGDRFRITGAVRSAASAAAVRQAGATPLRVDLDRGRSLARLAGLAPRVLVLAPPGTQDRREHRVRRLLCTLRGGPGAGRHGNRRGALRGATARRLIYLSTTGVYGDRRGAWTDETATPAPRNERAWRRLDAERRVRYGAWRGAVLRVPGIYGPGRLPLARLRESIPVPLPHEDVVTNHVHADDLARATIAALFRAAPARVYNAVDDSELLLGEYLDRIADHAGLARPRRAPWEEMRTAAGPLRMSFLDESRRLRNTRLKRELRLRLLYPDIEAGLAAMTRPPPGADEYA